MEGRGGHATSGRVSTWLCRCAQRGHQQPGITASLHLLGRVTCLPQRHSLHFLATISVLLPLFISASTLEEAGNERASEHVSGGGRGRTCFQAGQSNPILVADAQRDSVTWWYEHRFYSWLQLCPWESGATAVLICKMRIAIMSASRGGSVQGSFQL